MANIIDYAGSNKRKLTEDGFNELDGLVLSQLSYINWEENEKLSDSDLAEFGIDSEQLSGAYGVGGAGLPLSQMIALIMKTDHYNVLGDNDRKLLQSLVGNARYADMVVSNYFHRNIPSIKAKKLRNPQVFHSLWIKYSTISTCNICCVFIKKSTK